MGAGREGGREEDGKRKGMEGEYGKVRDMRGKGRG